MIGGTDFSKNQFNIVTQGLRQPGSSFKPFVYTTALLHGYTPTTRVEDRAHRYPSGTGEPWVPKDSDWKYLGTMQLQKALWQSRNAVAVAVAADVGIDKVIDIAHRMGVKSPLDPVLPTAIGASSVTPLEMCSGYGTLANHGVHNAPVAIVRVTTHDGEVLYENSAAPERVIPTDVADTMKMMMRGVVERGTGMRARCPFPVSGKTGTTSAFHDAWFIGYTDDLVTAVWVCNRGNEPMNHTFGADVPAPIFRNFMLVAQPIMADEHRQIKNDLIKINTKPELTDLDRTPTNYALRHGGVAYQGPSESPDSAGATDDPTVVKPLVNRQNQQPSTRVIHVHNATNPPAQTSLVTPHNASGRGILISICADSGKIATKYCPHVIRKRFLPGEPIPTETCPIHRR
jgi:membrane peptidoglycan carboxypeptidase